MRPTLTMRILSTLALTLATGIAAAGPEHADHAEHAEGHECGPDCADQCCLDLAKTIDFKTPELWIGEQAPKLQIAQFVKGESVNGFDKDHVYVVEFWATWCGPCVAAFPHLSELQKKFGEKVTFVGVNIWDKRDDETEAQRIDRVTEFVKGQGARMGYTVAVEDGTKMADTWMTKAKQNGIPCAFIVDGSGKVAWMGHPMGMEEALADVVAGKSDYAKTAESLKDKAVSNQAYNFFAEGIRSEDKEENAKAYRVGRALATQKFADDAGMLNALAWPILDDPRVVNPDYQFAYDIADKACAATDWKDPMILDTYSLAAFKIGQRDKAIEIEKKAFDLLGEDGAKYRDEFEKRLKMYQNDG